MIYLLLIPIISSVFVIIYFWRRRNESVPAPTQITHGGVQIISPIPVTSAAMDAIDAGISLQIERSSAAHPDWIHFGTLSDYRIQFIAPQAINNVDDPGSPAIFVNGIQAAGTCSFNPPTIILPYQQNWEFLEYLKQSARNESEHVRLFTNDQSLFYYYTNDRDVHPIFP